MPSLTLFRQKIGNLRRDQEAPDGWLAEQDRFSLLNQLWGAVARPDVSVDLLLHSRSEAARRTNQPGSVVQQAFTEGVLLHAPS